MTCYCRKQSLKQLYIEALEGPKAARQRKAPGLKKGKTLTLGSKLAVAEGGDVNDDEVADE
jgi:hypothetical protein